MWEAVYRRIRTTMCFGIFLVLGSAIVSQAEETKTVKLGTISYGFLSSKVSILPGVYDNPSIIIILMCIIFLIIIMSLFFFLRVKINNQKYLIKMVQIEEERYRVASEITNDILFEYEIPKDIMKASDKFYEVFGRNQTMYHFTEYLESKKYVHMEDLSVFEEFCIALHYGKEIVEAEFRLTDKTGEYVWCHIRGKTIYNNDKVPIKVIGKIVNIDIQKRELEKLLFKSQRDPLTNVYNKMVTKEKIDQLLADSKRHEKHALMLIDIDDFKTINDKYGHQLGDKVLTGVISYVQSLSREDDIIGRIGGDEFLVFMSGIKSREQIMMKAEMLTEAFRNTFEHEEEEVVISGSIGVALYPIHGMDYDSLVQKADIALYQVKSQGKDNYRIYEETKQI